MKPVFVLLPPSGQKSRTLVQMNRIKKKKRSVFNIPLQFNQLALVLNGGEHKSHAFIFNLWGICTEEIKALQLFHLSPTSSLDTMMQARKHSENGGD